MDNEETKKLRALLGEAQCRARNQSLVGKVFGRLTVTAAVAANGSRHDIRVKCSCGTERDVHACSVIAGNTTSCGCLRKELARVRARKNQVAGITHGMSKTKLYRTWSAMLHRCEDPTDVNWKNYGGRGITVCIRWHEFQKFVLDMGDPPSPEHQIDRRNNSLGYKPSNCRWATRAENSKNRRTPAQVALDDAKVEKCQSD